MTAFVLFPPLPQAMESKLLVGGKNIIDHTNEQQKMLESKRQEIAEQVNLLTCICPDGQDHSHV